MTKKVYFYHSEDSNANLGGDAQFLFPSTLRVSQGFWGTREHWQNIEGNKETLANFWEQGTKFRKITVRKHSERVWEHGNIGQFWKGTREQGPPWETLNIQSDGLGFAPNLESPKQDTEVLYLSIVLYYETNYLP